MISIRKSTLIHMMLVIICIAEAYFFCIFRVSNDAYVALDIILILTLYAVFLLDKHIHYSVCEKWRWITFYLIVWLTFFLFELPYMVYRYPRDINLYTFVVGYKQFLFVFLAPLIFYLLLKEGIERVLDIVAVVACMTIGLTMIHAVFFNARGTELLQITFYYEKSIFRNGRMRLWDVSSYEGLAVIYCFWKSMETKRRRPLYIGMTVIDIVGLLYVEQTRMMQIALMAAIFMMVFSKRTNHITSAISKIAIVAAIIASVAYYIIPYYISSLSAYMYSTTFRLKEILFSMQTLKAHPWFGIGMIDPFPDIRRSISRLPYYMGDIGLLGFMTETGIVWSVLLFGIPMIRLAWIINKVDWSTCEKPLLNSIYTFLLITSLTLFIFDRWRIPAWPFILALFEYVYYKYSDLRMNVNRR